MHRVRCRGGGSSKKLVRGPLAGGLLAMVGHLFTVAMASLLGGCFYSTYDTDFFFFLRCTVDVGLALRPSWLGIQNSLVPCDFRPLSAETTGMHNYAWLSNGFLFLFMLIKHNLNVRKSA